MAGTARPLAGILVLDFGRVHQGPCAASLPAVAGAALGKIVAPWRKPSRRRAAVAVGSGPGVA